MNSLIENNYITKMPCGSNFSYVLSDNCTFLSTEYKVLQSQTNSCFIQCMKMLYNGKVQLYYLSSKYKSLSVLLPSLDADSFMTISANLIADIINVKNNGFLSCQNIDISLEHIYVDPTTYKVSLIYLPVRQRLFDDVSSFENELRTSFVKLIQSISTLSTSKTIQFATNLSNGAMTLEDLYSTIKTGKMPIRNTDVSSDGSTPVDTQMTMRIIAMNSPTRVEIAITKDEFILGKKQEIVDGVISFNKMISRSHCKINRSGAQFTITDLQSANGTYVNRVRCQPNQPYPIKNGDIIRLANSDFQVSIR